MNLRTMMRVGDVTRWHIVRTARQQTLAEHLYKTWLLTGALYDAIGLPPETRGQALQWALTHDLPEVLTGDMPTPVKRAVEARTGDGDVWRKLERDAMRSEATHEDWMQPLVVGTPIAYVVKIADCVEGWHFLEVEAVGKHALDTQRKLLVRAEAVADAAALIWPKYDWRGGLARILAMLKTLPIEHCQ